MRLLGIDVESTGLSIESDRIIEVGAAVWNTEDGTPTALFSSLVWDTSYPALTEDIQFLTGIRQEDLIAFGKLPNTILLHIIAMAREYEVSAFVAHNGTDFDRPMLLAEVARGGELGPKLPELPWIDTSVDIEYPKHMQTRKLSYLAAEHGFLNPFAHRALFDVMTMLKVMSHYSAEKILASALQPSVKIQAHTVKPWEDNYASVNEAKARGFRWHGETKQWIKNVKAHKLEEERAAPFKISEVI